MEKPSKLRSFDTGNKVGLRTVLSSRLQTENCAVRSGNPTVSSVYLPKTRCHTHKTHTTDKKENTDKPDRETCAVPENIQFSFSYNFFYAVNP